MRYTNPLAGLAAGMGQAQRPDYSPLIEAIRGKQKSAAEIAELKAMELALNPQAEPPQQPPQQPLEPGMYGPPAPPSTATPMPGGPPLRERLQNPGGFRGMVNNMFGGVQSGPELANDAATLRGRMAGNAARQKSEADTLAMRLRGNASTARADKLPTQDADGNPIWLIREADGTEYTYPRDGRAPNLRGFERYDAATKEQFRVDDSGAEIPGTRQPSRGLVREQEKERDREEGRILSGADISKIGDARLAINASKQVQDLLQDPEIVNLFGPLRGKLGSNNPYSVDYQKLDSALRTVRQTIGKFREGGVLRAEDEIKYLRMLPQPGDLPDVAMYKAQLVADEMMALGQGLVDDYRASGYRVPERMNFQQPTGGRNAEPDVIEAEDW